MDPSMQVLDPGFEVRLVVMPRYAIHAGGGLALKRVKRRPERVDIDVVEERGELPLLPDPTRLGPPLPGAISWSWTGRLHGGTRRSREAEEQSRATAPDTEPGARDPGAGPRTGSRKAKCFADPRSPWSPALAPPAPQPRLQRWLLQCLSPRRRQRSRKISKPRKSNRRRRQSAPMCPRPISPATVLGAARTVGEYQNLKSGKIDFDKGTITLPLYHVELHWTAIAKAFFY